MARRPRTPHFIAGLGDGNVHHHHQVEEMDDLFRRQRRPLFEHVRRRSEPPLLKPKLVATEPASPWQISAMALLCVMGLLLALFLHVITDTTTEFHRKKSPTKRKKTDEWSEDEVGNYNADSESNAPPPLYYAPRYHVQQEHRHRKISACSNSELMQSSAAATSSRSPVVINSRPYYHHNMSGAFAAPSVAAPMQHTKKSSPRATPRPNMRAQPLSPVSSFASLSHATEDEDVAATISVTSIPPPQETSNNNLLLSPGTEDFVTPKAGPRRRLLLPKEAVETAVPYSGAALPFIPNLETQQEPPRSMEHDAFHCMMESGHLPSSSSSWEEDTTAISTTLPKQQAYPGHPSPLKKSSNGDSQHTTTPSAPRNNIIHKRKDLTMSTDAGSSLLSSIDFNELTLHQVIGGGGFGQVYKATWRGTPVAVKMLNAVSKSILQEFAAEINMLRGMRHPNICLYMGACLEPPNRAIVTELASNGSLWDALRLPLEAPYVASDGQNGPPGTWPWALIMRVACGAARGMTYLHSGTPPVLHRDLKSANLLLDDAYTAKVCDFGLSRLKAQQVSMTGNCGTVQWMAPEVLANQRYAEPADVYSFGIILWELLTRECPYEGMSAIQCALAVLNRDHRPETPEWCPAALAALIAACVEKDPSKRPTFAQIILALDAMS